jgi:hypothetical protein
VAEVFDEPVLLLLLLLNNNNNNNTASCRWVVEENYVIDSEEIKRIFCFRTGEMTNCRNLRSRSMKAHMILRRGVS